MAKKAERKFLGFVAWLTGIIVSLAVGFALIGGTLSVPYLGFINIIAGWIVILTTLLGLVLALLKY